MHALNLPQFEYQIKNIGSEVHIFDIIRKKYVKNTPEEWVRQHMIHLLINHYAYPKNLISCEKGLSVNKLAKRSDIVVYNNDLKPYLLIECKAPKVALSQETFHQAARYNSTLKAPYMCISNGLITFSCKINFDTNNFEFLNDIPPYAL